MLGLLSRVPQDMVISAGVGVVLCGAFLAFGNTDRPYVLPAMLGGDDAADRVGSASKDTDAGAGTGTQEGTDIKNDTFETAGDAIRREHEAMDGPATSLISQYRKASATIDAADASKAGSSVPVPAPGTAEGNEPLPAVLTAEEEKVMRKLKEIQHKFGFDESVVEEALAMTADQRDKGIKTLEQQRLLDDPPMSWFRVFDILIWIILLVAGCWALNEHTQGNAGRVLMGMFPKEVKAMGAEDYLQRYGLDGFVGEGRGKWGTDGQGQGQGLVHVPAQVADIPPTGEQLQQQQWEKEL